MSRRVARDPFLVRGRIKVRDSAVVICARRRPHRRPSVLTPEDCGDASSPFLRKLMPRPLLFDSGWEVLLGQATVVNWLKTTPQKLRIMRYAGEWKLAGGNVDEGESVVAAARRELHEEFLAPLGIRRISDADVRIRPFVTKQTRPIRDISNMMNCFVALEDENQWLKDLDVADVNRGLARRRRRFARESMDKDGRPSPSFYQKSVAEREELTPEVHEIQWMPLRDALRHMLSSMVPGTRVNAFQKKSFEKYGRTRRDPMFITGAILMELETFPDEASLLRYCRRVDLDELTRNEQWLFDGMNAEDVANAFRQRRPTDSPTNPVFKSSELVKSLKLARRDGPKSSL